MHIIMENRVHLKALLPSEENNSPIFQMSFSEPVLVALYQIKTKINTSSQSETGGRRLVAAILESIVTINFRSVIFEFIWRFSTSVLKTNKSLAQKADL